MASDIDYRNTEIPDETPRPELSYAQRRADILRIMRREGHPRQVRQTDLADKYGVDQSTISRDVSALSEYIDETLGDRRTFLVSLVFDRSIRGLLDDEDWRKAAQTAHDYSEWVDERATLTEMADRLEAIEEHQQRARYR
jgi:hypothetical protein